jgi:hypothetical protein
LIAVGNRNVKDISNLSFPNSKTLWTYLPDGVWLNKDVTMEECMEQMMENKDPKPIIEFTNSFDITVTEDPI